MLIENLRDYRVAMLQESFVPIACPGCSSERRELLVKYDRYLLPVHVSLCTDCGLVYTAHTASGAALERFYAQDYRRMYEQVERVTAAYVHRSKDKLAAGYRLQRIREVVGEFASVLEVGSGLGYFLDACRAAGVERMLGLELGAAFAAYGRDALGLGDIVQQKRYQEFDVLPFAPQLVTLFHVFEHLENPREFLAWLQPRMVADGWVVIEVPNILGDWSSLGLGYFHLAHRSYFCAESLCNMLASAGFTPRFVMSDDRDGIFPGNLSVYAQVGQVAAGTYPLTVPQHKIRATVQQYCRPMSLQHGYPRAVLRLVRRAMQR